MLEVVTGIILLERAQPVPDLAVGQDDLDAQNQIARIAKAQHLHPAGIGRQIAANLAAPLGAEAEREQPVGLGGCLL